MQSYTRHTARGIPEIRYICTLAASILMIFTSMTAATDDTPGTGELLLRRADNFFSQREWLNAAVTYERLLRLDPRQPQWYGRGITAAAMADEPDTGLRLTRTAMEHGVPVDSLFNAVRTASFTIGRSNLYEQYIITTAHAYPWMSRIANVRLLDYYDYRSDGPAMTRYALRLLGASPNSVPMLAILARGYLLQSMFSEAVSVYSRILTLQPDNLDALLHLGNYYADHAATEADRDLAATYLTRANRLSPSPYIAARLRRLVH